MRHATLLFGVAAWIALSVPADAARLAADACETLKAEQDQLAQSGVRDDMQRGPQWAKANLPAARLGRIKRLIEVEEQIAFRCLRPRVAATPAPAAPAAAAPDQPKPAVAAAPAEGEAAPPAPRRGKKKGHRAAAGPLPAPAAAAAAETPAQAPPAAEPNASGEAATPKAKKGRRAKPAADAQTAGGAATNAPSADPKTTAPVKSQ